MKIKKAVIPAAGLGTRVLPASKVMPKEMLPIVDKPAIQYIVEEAVASGITDILIITSRGKGLVEDHFDNAYELEDTLRRKGRNADADAVAAIAHMANVHFVRQHFPNGLGHAVLSAKAFVGCEPFAVLYGDDVMASTAPVTAQLCAAYEKYGKGAVGVKQVPDEALAKYCSLKVEPLEGAYMAVSDMVEKPTPEQVMSNWSILGRCVLPGEIFEILENTAPGFGGEIQLTDAMATLARTQGMIGVDFEGKRYDMGNKLGIMQAQVETALKHPEIGDAFREYLKEFVKTL